MENNFKCKDCESDFFVPNYIFKIESNDTVYYYKTTNNKIECPGCRSNNIKPIFKDGDYTNATLGKYTMKSIPERQDLLKKRSRDHFERKIKDEKREIDRNPGLQMIK